MAKGSESPGFCRFGAETLLARLETLGEQIEGAKRADDIEYVHQSRVASRRIRAALPIFRNCFPKKAFKRWGKQIKAVTGSLGMARDLDVQMVFIRSYLEEGDNVGVARLLLSHQARREAIQPEVVGSVDAIIDSGVIGEMVGACERLLEADVDAEEMMRETRNLAYTHLHHRLEELMELEPYVRDESQKLKHHEMRIAAKRLRYTMEIFRPAYDAGMDGEIGEMKKLQDVLGDMHDCDVWMEYLPHFVADLKVEEDGSLEADLEAGIEAFEIQIQRIRDTLYVQFVERWDSMGCTFADLREKMRAGLEGVPLRELLTMVEEDRPPVLALISDVHSNLDALQAVMKEATEREVEGFLNAGDSLGYAPYPNRTAEELMGGAFINVVGNYDLEILDQDHFGEGLSRSIKREVKGMISSRVDEWVHALPREERLLIGGKRVLLTHGSPVSIEEHIYADTDVERLRELARVAEADVIVIGHSHEQFVREVEGTVFINPGSVGRPDDGDPRAEWALVCFDPLNVELLRTAYDIEGTVEMVRKLGFPEELAQVFLRGTSLKSTIASMERKELTEERMGDDLKVVRRVAERYEWDISHPEQVRRLALRLFDDLAEMHDMGPEERHWLECAALLHDIGWSRGWKGHNKTSMTLIMNDQDLPFDVRERHLVSSLARYHRKTFPSLKHYNYAALGPVDRARVDALASILRVADGLDYSHGALVDDIKATVGPERVIVRCQAKGPGAPEERSANKKKDLFEQVFKRDLVIEWVPAGRSPS